MPVPLSLVVYSRKDCHLCDNMIAALRALQARLSFCFEVADVDRSADLRLRYGSRVPVLTWQEQEICHYHLDPVALAQCLSRVRVASGQDGDP